MLMSSDGKTPEKVYIVFSKEGDRQYNVSTGTRIYTRKANAVRKAYKSDIVVEYDLVPTGNTFDKTGEPNV